MQPGKFIDPNSPYRHLRSIGPEDPGNDPGPVPGDREVSVQRLSGTDGLFHGSNRKGEYSVNHTSENIEEVCQN